MISTLGNGQINATGGVRNDTHIKTEFNSTSKQFLYFDSPKYHINYMKQNVSL